MIQEWNIRPRSSECSNCKTAFEDGQICVSGIENQEPEWIRRDFCPPCWKRFTINNPAFGAWRSRYRTPQKQRPGDPVRHETAESLLRRLIDEDATSNAAVIFVLAVMLERKKILVERDARDLPNGCRERIYEHRKSGELMRIADPGLNLDDLRPVQEIVLQRLASHPAA